MRPVRCLVFQREGVHHVYRQPSCIGAHQPGLDVHHDARAVRWFQLHISLVAAVDYHVLVACQRQRYLRRAARLYRRQCAHGRPQPRLILRTRHIDEACLF